jgi:hypothetical protein
MTKALLFAALTYLVAAPASSQEAAPSSAPAGPGLAQVVRCSNYVAVLQEAGFPRNALRQKIYEGSAEVEFTLDGDEIRNIRVLQFSAPVFRDEAIRIATQLRCGTSSQPVQVRFPLQWRVE